MPEDFQEPNLEEGLELLASEIEQAQLLGNEERIRKLSKLREDVRYSCAFLAYERCLDGLRKCRELMGETDDPQARELFREYRGSK